MDTRQEIVESLVDCRFCGKAPRPGSVLWMGFHIECVECGLTIPFPPVKTLEEAAEKWNEAQDNDGRKES